MFRSLLLSCVLVIAVLCACSPQSSENRAGAAPAKTAEPSKPAVTEKEAANPAPPAEKKAKPAKPAKQAKKKRVREKPELDAEVLKSVKLVNKSFENWNEKGQPLRWKIVGNVAKSTEAKHGETSVELKAAEGEKATELQQGFGQLKEVAGARVRFSAWLKTPKSGEATLRISYRPSRSEGWKHIDKVYEGSEEWQKVMINEVLPWDRSVDSVMASIELKPGATAPVLVDSANLVLVPSKR